ncbi:MAG: hypothetical protein K8R58_03505, partial [Bacteroidales bacterium]|nr:hypothetical protein [Bacteroidales bacterium]
KKPKLKADKIEVREIIEIDIFNFLNKNVIVEKEIFSNNIKIKVPCYNIKEYTIWGATAMIISEFVELIRN